MRLINLNIDEFGIDFLEHRYYYSICGTQKVRCIVMSPRIGRPKIDKPKCIDVKVRFDEGTHSKLMKYCEENNLTRTEALRKCVELLINKK